MEINGIPEEILAQHVVALGKTGSGKSSKLRVLVEHILDQQLPVSIIDPKGDWWGLKLSADGKKAGYPVVIFGGEHADVPINKHAGKQVAEIVVGGNRPCIIDLGEMMVGERTRFFIDFVSTLFRNTRGPRYLVIDEVHNFAPKSQMRLKGDTPMMLHWANRLASEGRGKGIKLIAASQRSQKVHNDFLTSCETLIAGRVIHPSDRAAIKLWTDGCADEKLGKELLAGLASMKRAEAWVWSPEIDFGPKKINFDLFKTYDSFKPQTQEEFESLEGWAELDLDDVREKFSALIEEEKSNDPNHLRLKIADLEKQLRRHTKCLTPQQHASKLTEELNEFVENYVAPDSAANTDKEMTIALQKIHKIAECFVSGDQPVSRQTAPRDTRPREKIKSTGHLAIRNGAISGPQQRILDSLAWWETTGIDGPYTRVQVASMAEYAAKGSAFKSPVSTLKTAGMVDYPQSAMLTLTDLGREQAEYPKSIGGTEELHRVILGRLSGPQRKLLRIALDTYPNEISRPEMAAMTDYSTDGSAFKSPLSSLRSLGLIEYPRQGHVIASKQLFLEK